MDYHVSPILFFVILGVELLILGVLIVGLYILLTPKEEPKPVNPVDDVINQILAGSLSINEGREIIRLTGAIHAKHRKDGHAV